MKRWLLLDAGASIQSALRELSTTVNGGLEIVVATDAEQALGMLDRQPVERLAIAAGCAPRSIVRLVSQAVTKHPELEVVACTVGASRLDGPTSLATGICFVSDAAQLVSLRSPAARRPARTTLPRPDVVDITRLAVAFDWSCEIRVQGPGARGLMVFGDGALAGATAGHLRGNDAFLQMVLWDSCRFEARAREGPLPDAAAVTAPTVELLEEAVNLCRAIVGDPGGDTAAPDQSRLQAWWQLASTGSPSMVRVLIGSTPGRHVDCARRFTDVLEDQLRPERRWTSTPTNGPTFVRLHSKHGTVLALTFVEMAPHNRFYFESFAGRSEVVVICRQDCNGDIEQWRNWIADASRIVYCKQPCPSEECCCRAVLSLAESCE